MTPQEITHYSELMARFEGYEYYPWNNPESNSMPGWKANPKAHIKLPASGFLCRQKNGLKYHTSYDWLHRVWVKFRDLKTGFTLEEYDHHYDAVYSLIFTISERPIEEAFLELGRAIEWYNQINQPGKH